MTKSRKFLIALTVIFCVGFMNAQNTKNLFEKLEEKTERMSDPYLPNEFANQQTSPAYNYHFSRALNQSLASVTTVQVNVNSSGQNILGDAANEPDLVINPALPNNVIIGWRQFDNVTSNFRQAGWAFSTNAGTSWTFPGSIQPGVFRSDPVLDYDLNGKFYYNSLTNTPDYFCRVFESTNNGASWNSGTSAQGGDKQWMAIDHTSGVGSGNIYESWTGSVGASSCDPGFFSRSTNGNVSYESCITVAGYPWWGAMTVGNSGELFLAGGSGFSMDSIMFVKSLNAKIAGSTIAWDSLSIYMDGRVTYYTPINPAGMIGQINIEVDRSGSSSNGNIYILASLLRISNSDPSDVMFVKSTDGGATWSTPVRINDDASATNNQWLATMSVAPNGRIDATWLDTRDAPVGSDSSALYYAYSIDAGNTWSVNEKLSGKFNPHAGYPNQSKMGDYMNMQSDNTSANLAWCATFNGEQNIYFSRITPNIATGFAETFLNNSILVFPNPTRNTIFISGIEEKSELEIYSVIGEKVISNTISNSKTEMDISFLPPGIYFLVITNRFENSQIRKIVKQ